MLKPYQIKFIDFLVKSGALTFGDFTTKSGRKTPYFVNTGNFNSGAKIGQLGGFYADHIVNLGLGRIDLIFGPAYKGIPLAVATSAALATQHQMDIGFAFNRKEAKELSMCVQIITNPLEMAQYPIFFNTNSTRC